MLSVFVAAFLFFSCSGDNGGTTGGDTILKPTNLTVVATPVGVSTQNPNGDGSGTVNFTISATNATSYKVALGDGETRETSSGTLSYTYTVSGTNSYTIYVSAYNGAQFISTSIPVTIYVAPKAIWSDEFNVDGAPDATKWAYDIGTGDWGWGNNEAQYYTSRADNVKVQNGVLKIIAQRENYSGSNYTSARIKTQGKFTFKYGRVEMRAKLPSGGGTWPALWMLGNNITTAGWPACGEIDIMEHLGNQLNKIYGTLHHPGHSGGNADSRTVDIANATSEFHIYALDWRADAIKFYVDNQLFYTFTNTSSLPFNQNFFLIINCAIGGNFGGTIDPNFVSSTYEVDYIRVFN
ncbi:MULTISPECIES: family 16 glycosylhydrolase [Flavobacterium]|uniref:Family 16 glycosylhydrolase n=1 Tax=Flavobacterium keumense TaxID=1306518 RepID=A0ABY8N7I2_9FLAO|nr:MULTISPECIES: family 16 glycosylhydrolase [Flavobacterium]WGK95620.1 family 16 glycosylhydrolase [Flavobacterium keumense]